MLSNLLQILIYPSITICYYVTSFVDSIIKFTKYVTKSFNKYLIKLFADEYVDIITYTQFNDFDDQFIHNYYKYKKYLYVTHNNKIQQAQLLINKHTSNMAYVLVNYNGTFVEIEKDINKYKISI